VGRQHGTRSNDPAIALITTALLRETGMSVSALSQVT